MSIVSRSSTHPSLVSRSSTHPSLVRNLYLKVSEAFLRAYAKPATLRNADASRLCRDVTQSLQPMRVPFLADHHIAVSSTLGNVRVTALCDTLSDRTDEVAEYTARMCALWGYRKKVEIVLAMAPQTKHISFERPLTMNDINSGVTFPEKSQIIMFRYDRDFWKVLCHELIHLCCGERDEAVTECKVRGEPLAFEKASKTIDFCKSQQNNMIEHICIRFGGLKGPSPVCVSIVLLAFTKATPYRPCWCTRWRCRGTGTISRRGSAIRFQSREETRKRSMMSTPVVRTPLCTGSSGRTC